MSYQLVSAENEIYTRQIAAKADEMIRRMMQNNPQLSLNMAGILALVNSLDELSRVLQQHGALENQKNEAEKQAAEARKELMRMREQNWEMKKELLRLNARLQELESLLAQKTPAAPQAQASPPSPPSPVRTEPADIDFNDDKAYAEDSAANGTAAHLTQTNLDDYLRAGKWQNPPEHHADVKPESR